MGVTSNLVSWDLAFFHCLGLPWRQCCYGSPPTQGRSGRVSGPLITTLVDGVGLAYFNMRERS